MSPRARVESRVLSTAESRGLVSRAQVNAARADHASALARGEASDLLAHLSRRLDPDTRSGVRVLYHEALRAESSSDHGSTRLDEPASPPTVVDPNMTYMEPPLADAAGLASTRAAAPDPDRTLAGPPPAPYGLESALPPAGPADSSSGPTLLLPTPSPGASITVPPPGASSPRSAAAPPEIPGYRIEGELGRGGMGVVYRATADDGATVAIKLLLSTGTARAQDFERFRLEATTASRLEHPHVVAVLEHGEVSGNPFMVLDYVEGEDLEQRIAREGRLDPAEAVEIAIGIADALAYAHEQGVLHRDLKPQNVLLDKDGHPLLTDFGLAKLRGESAPTLSLTQSGAMLGTPAYMSPEQADADRHKIDERTDVYGLGATLYHMLCGCRPFAGQTLAALVMEIMTKPAPPLRGLVPDLDPDLETIVLTCLEKEREDRYASAGQLLRDLSRWQKDLAIVAARPTLVTRAQRAARKNPLAAAGVAVGCLALLFAGGVVVHNRGAQAELKARLAALDETPPPTASAALDPSGPSPADPPARPDATPRAALTADTPTVADEQPTATEVPADDEPAATEVPTDEAPTATEVPADDEPTATEVPADDEPTATEVPTADGDLPQPAPLVGEGAPRVDRRPSPAEPPPPVREPPPPPPTPREGLAELPPAAPPPPWLVRRIERLAAAGRGPAYVSDWGPAVDEARALNVPLVAVVVGPDARRPSLSALRALDELAVAVLARGPHPPEGPRRPPPRPGPGRPGPGGPPPGQPPGPPPVGRQSGPCPDFEGLNCQDHVRVQQRVSAAGVPYDETSLRLAVFTGEGLRAVGARKGGDFRLSTSALKKALGAVQEELGAPALPLDALDDLGPALLELERQPPEHRGPGFARHADAPGVLGEWARFRAREACRGALDRARAEGRLERALPELREAYGEEPGCARMLDRAGD